MRGYMFRNRWLAMLFVALVLAGVTRVVGTGKGDGIIDEATEQLAAQRERAEALSDEIEAEAPEQAETEDDAAELLASDEDLIDPAIGEDPTPPDEFAGDNGVDSAVVEEGDIFLVDNGPAETVQPGY
ncbi:hypothetical protein [Tsuneonella troitsensis]|uniref:hypothetical protein n=1 Tax=Tsuneonella troitsensis TaxID=292222 RepID=UPI00070BC947|nr:hypothetical protein [Tsuneonella troitsensis]